MEFLAHALNDPGAGPCGKCRNCLGRDIISRDISPTTIKEATLYLEHGEMSLYCNKQVEEGAFIEYEFETILPESERAEKGKILSRWGSAGWGECVVEDKRKGEFRDKLVEAMAEMIKNRWNPDPFPQWITCIPSSNNPHLVPNFAERLGKRIGLPFIPVIEKVKKNKQQKTQNSEFFRCQNLDGVFRISDSVRDTPVLLLDDIVDSCWTLTVATALLRRKGSGIVYPIALATSATGN